MQDRSLAADKRKKLLIRASIIQAIRAFFVREDYLEIETPCRIPAPAPEAHIDAITSENLYLHTSPELCMKRMLAAGFPRIFQICKCFRSGERGERHLPEFSMIEWYTARAGYIDMMRQCEKLVQYIAWKIDLNQGCLVDKMDAERPEGVLTQSVGTRSHGRSSHEDKRVDPSPLRINGDPVITYQRQRIDLSSPWDRITVADSFARYAGCSMKDAMNNDRFDEIIALQIEPHLGWQRPVFLYDYPKSMGSLAKLKTDNKDVVERFELYIGGMELCNAFTELTDPAEQRMRFVIENQTREKAGKAPYPMPEKFLQDLQFMPEATGNALGIDRLVMLFTDTTIIDDVVAFTPESL